MRLLTNSRAKTARACRRKHHLRYTLGITPISEAPSLRFGTLIHHGLEAWFSASRARDPQESWLDRALGALDAHSNGVDPYDMARAQVMLAGYHTRWADAPLEVLAVECAFECELRNPRTGASSRTWRLAGKLDAVVKTTDGRILIVEHKTSSEDVSSGSDYWRRLRMDGQVSTYFTGARSLGLHVDGCLYDVLCKPAQRPSVAKSRSAPETPEEFRQRLAEAVAAEPTRYFARGEVARLESELVEYQADTWALAQQLREEELEGRHPRNVDACHTYGRPCPYLELCCGEASIDDPTRFTVSADVHPELSQEVPSATPA